MTGFTVEDYQDLANLIRDIVKDEVNKIGADIHKTAIVKSVNENGTVNAYFLSDPNNAISNIKNPHGYTFIGVDDFPKPEEGEEDERFKKASKIQVLCKGGNINNSWIVLKQ